MEYNMKKILKHFNASKVLIIALAVIIGFSMAGCGDKDDEAEKLPTNYGSKLDLSGDVFLEEFIEGEISGDEFDVKVTYTKLTDEIAIKNTYGGIGTVTSGILNYSIGVPTGLVSLNFDDIFNNIKYGGFEPSGTAQGVVLYSLETVSDTYSDLYRGNTVLTNRDNGISVTIENVIYVYVDKDVIVSGYGWKGKVKPGEIDDLPCTITQTVDDLNLVLKTGWNAVYEKSTQTITRNISEGGKLSSYSMTESYKMSLNNPNLKWYTTAITKKP
jgi:hypothetical protein